MASVPGISGEVSEETVRAGLGATAKDRLAALQLVAGSEGQARTTAAVFLLQCRSNGFLALLPQHDAVLHAIQDFDTEGQDLAIRDVVTVELETSRGRALGPCNVSIVDLPWSYLPLFRKASARRSGAGGELVLFRSDDNTVARPSLQSALEAARLWIAQVLDADTANEYTDALEDPDIDGEEVPEEDINGTPLSTAAPGPSGEVAALRGRVAQLEQMLLNRPEVPTQTAPSNPPRPLLAPPPTGNQELSVAELQRLRAAVGQPPRRLGRGDQPAALAAPPPTLEGQLAAEVGREVRAEFEDADQVPAEVQTALQS